MKSPSPSFTNLHQVSPTFTKFHHLQPNFHHLQLNFHQPGCAISSASAAIVFFSQIPRLRVGPPGCRDAGRSASGGRFRALGTPHTRHASGACAVSAAQLAGDARGGAGIRHGHLRNYMKLYGGVSGNGGTPSYHPNFNA